MNFLNLGKKGENAACEFLKRNYSKKYGEIDIVAKKENLISFIEVKTRSNTDFGLACEAVSKGKQERIIKTAKTFILEYKLNEDYSFDIIEVYHNNGVVQKIEHIENAFY